MTLDRAERNKEKVRLKTEIKEMLKTLGISRGLFNRTLPRMRAKGYKYYIDENGRKSSLRQRHSFLKDLVEYKKKEDEENAE